MYNLLTNFLYGVNFFGVPVFWKNIRIARAGKNFCAQKNSGFFFSRQEKILCSGFARTLCPGPNGQGH